MALAPFLALLLAPGQRSSTRSLLRVLPVMLLACGVTTAGAWEKVDLQPSQDNTLYESPIDQGESQFELSNGAGDFLFSGRTAIDAGFRRRRALLRFDLESALPPGATVLAVELTLYQSRAAPGAPPADMGLHRVLQAWGEAGSQGIGPEGQGNFAEEGDATWHHRLYPDDLWDTAGGHFEASPSAVTVVGQDEVYFTWLCSTSLLNDVQFWQQNPAANFGWILVGGEESGSSAHRFNSRENDDTALRPRLTIYYTRETTVFENSFEQPFSCP